MEGKRVLRRSPRISRVPKRRRSSSILPPAKSILKKNENATTFDIQNENTTITMYDESTENDKKRRRTTLGRSVSFASKAHVRLFDKNEFTGRQPNPLNGDEASDFTLTILPVQSSSDDDDTVESSSSTSGNNTTSPTPSPNDSVIESSISTSRTQSIDDGEGKDVKLHISPQIEFNIILNENQSMSQAPNSKTPMICQYNSTLRSTNDQYLPKGRDGAFAFKDMSNMDINTRYLNMEEYQKSESEEMEFVKTMIEEQNQRVELFEAELESINKKMQRSKKKRNYLIKEKAEIEQKIRDAKQFVEATQYYTEKDLNEVQEQYRFLTAKHKWFPRKLFEELVHLSHDKTVQIDVDIGDLLKRDAKIPFVEVSLNLINLDDNMNPEEKLYYQVIFGEIQKFALDYKGPIEIAQCSRIIKPITVYWENSKQLYRDYQVLRFKLPTEINNSRIISNNGKAIIVRFRVNFFNHEAKANFYIKFLFEWKDVISYPNISNLSWEIEPIYGEINKPFIKDTINKHLSSNVHGCIKNACVVIQENGFVF